MSISPLTPFGSPSFDESFDTSDDLELEELFPTFEMQVSTGRLNEEEQRSLSCSSGPTEEDVWSHISSTTDVDRLYPFGPIRITIPVVNFHADDPIPPIPKIPITVNGVSYGRRGIKRIGFSKIASRLHALSLLFSGYLPLRYPPSLSEEMDEWVKLKAKGKLVTFSAIDPCLPFKGTDRFGMIVVYVPRKLDIIYRLIAIEGFQSPLKWKETREATSTHSRWWTDSPICRPIKTRSFIKRGVLNEWLERSVTLPWEFLEPFYKSPNKSEVVKSVALLFEKTFEIYTQKDSFIGIKIANGMGRGRERIENAPPYEEALKAGIKAVMNPDC